MVSPRSQFHVIFSQLGACELIRREVWKEEKEKIETDVCRRKIKREDAVSHSHRIQRNKQRRHRSVFNNLYPNAVVQASASAPPCLNCETDATKSISVYDQSSTIFPILSQFIVSARK
ncbi:hypothetical protein VNO80_02191 [Phaseolus coccineus]|uniref:Uncharacterized protein n=1 Tax=Phaseolus coccineus TaxID=3886 RepID=A0AAN9RHR3_PHACN